MRGIKPGRFALVLLCAVGGSACHAQNELLRTRSGGTGGISGGSGMGGGVGLGGGSGTGGGGGLGGGSVPDGGTDDAPDGMPDAMQDVAPDGPTTPFAGYRWAALPAPLGAPMAAVTIDSNGVLYAGAGGGTNFSLPAQAGIFKSTDDGRSWRAANLGLLDYPVAALAAAGTTIFAGTSSLMRSADGGASWKPVVVGPSQFSAFDHIGAAGSLVVASSDSTSTSLWVSTDVGITFSEVPMGDRVTELGVTGQGSVILMTGSYSVLRSTDRGVTFNAVEWQNFIFLSFGCNRSGTCYAIARDNVTGPGIAFKSTDASATWTRLPGLFPGGRVAAVSDNGAGYINTGSTIERWDNGGATFTSIYPPTTTGAFQPNCSGPNPPPYAATGAMLFAGCFDGVYQYDEPARRWSASGSPATGPITGTATHVLVDTSPAALGPDGDIYVHGIEGRNPVGEDQYTLKRSSDGGWTWQTVASPFHADQCIVTPGGALMCGNVTTSASPTMLLARSDDRGATWRGRSLPTRSDGQSIGPVLTTHGSLVFLTGYGFARSTDDGLTFQAIPGAPDLMDLLALRNGHLIATTLGGGYRSNDQGATWVRIPGDTVWPMVEVASGRLIRYISGGGLEVSTDEAQTWTPLASRGFPELASAPVPLTADGAGHLFVFGGRPLQAYASADGGETFLPLPAPIPNPNTTSFATDKQGRLVVGTVGGVFRLESGAAPGPPRPDGGTPDGGAPAPRPTSLVRGPEISSTPLMLAAAAGERAFFSDYYNVRLIESGTTSIYLQLDEASSTAGLSKAAEGIVDLDVGPDGQLYVLLTGVRRGDPFSFGTETLVRSNAAHGATLMRELGTTTLGRMRVIRAGLVGYITSGGFWTTNGAGAQNLYTQEALDWTSTCPFFRRDFAVAASGAAAFLPGCVEGAILRGTVDGASLQVLYQPRSDLTYGEHFACIAKDPAGGFYAVVTDYFDRKNPRLVHLPEAATGAPIVPTLVPTVPTLGELSSLYRPDLFDACNLSTAPNGVIYLEGGTRIWRIGL